MAHPVAGEVNAADFLVAAADAKIVHVFTQTFNSSDGDLPQGELLFHGQDGSVDALACHPLHSLIVIGGGSGLLQVHPSGKKKTVLCVALIAVHCPGSVLFVWFRTAYVCAFG